MRSFILFLLIILSCAMFIPKGLAQKVQKDLKIRHLKENYLLSNLNITSIIQDSKGFLWVGTYDGLNRFDGYDFKIYRNIENDTTSLIKNQIESIFEDSRGIIWISTMNSGFHYYNRDTDAFCRVAEFSQQHCQVFRIIEGNDQSIWIGGVIDSKAFVATRNNQTGQWEKFLLFTAAEGITSMFQYSENEFWLGSRFNGLYHWNKQTKELKQYLHDANNPNSLPGNYIEEIIKDQNGFLWIGTRDRGLTKYDVEKNIFTNFTTTSSKTKTNIYSNAVRDFCLDPPYLWIGTESGGGLSRINTETGVLTNYNYEKGNPNSIINNSIWALHKDTQGRIWMGSFAKGLCVYDPLDDKIQTLDYGLENDLINAILEDSKDRLWIGTEDGLILKDKNVTHRFRNDPTNQNSIGSDAVLSILEDSHHQIWIGLWNGGINRYEESSNNFSRLEKNPRIKGTLTSLHAFSIEESAKTGELLVATFSGLNILKDKQNGIFENPFDYPYEGDLSQLTVFEDSKQNVWVGSFSGLNRYSLEDHRVERINLLNDTSKISDGVNCIYEDHRGSLWFGSNGGLHQMVNATEFITYTTKDQMPVNVVMGITEDAKGHIWLSTSKGISVFNPTTKVFKNYDESDGLNSNQLRRNSLFKRSDGQILVGGKGINTFYPDSMSANPYLPSVYITDLKIFNQSIIPNDKDKILDKDIAETKEIYLDYTHTSFTLHYVALNFTASYKNQYAFKLDGFDDDWIEVGTQRFTTYTNLDAGTYTFRVKASNNDGVWNEEGASLIIHVLPPWWKTWWANLVLIVLLAVLFYVIIRLRTSYLRNKQKILKQMVQESTSELIAKNEQIVSQAEELQAFNDSLNVLNENLEKTVEERTHELTIKNNKLSEYAFINAHNLRVPVANIKGILQLFENKKSIEEVLELIELLKGQSENLDRVLIDIQRMLEKDNAVKQNELKQKLN